MKFLYYLGILLVVLYTSNAYNIQKINKKDKVNSKSKRAETSNECKYINSMIGKDESYNCCEYEFREHKEVFRITCQNGHVTKIDLVYTDNYSITIPETIGKLTKLKELYLRNFLGGTIPESIGNLTELTNLDLSWSNLSGSIPESIGNLTKLTILNLNHNHFSGIIPKSFKNLYELEYIDVAFSNLSGTIPEFIGNFTKLEALEFTGNSFSGTIPESFENLNLYRFEFSYNCIDCSKVPEKNGWYCDSDITTEEKCNNKRCGMINGKDYGKCADGQCCSKKGYCGTTSSFCSSNLGCQKNYGKCIEGRCGNKWGSCPNDQCCSKKGYCGTTSSFCSSSKGCQKDYGKCK